MTNIPVQAGELVGIDYLNEVSRVHYRNNAGTAINGTIAKTALWTVTLAAGLLGSTGGLHLNAAGDWKNNSGGGVDLPRFVFDFGGTAIIDTNAAGAAASNSAARQSWRMTIDVVESSSATAQSVSLDLRQSYLSSSLQENLVSFAGGQGSYWSRGFNLAAGITVATGWNGAAANSAGTVVASISVINASTSVNYETALKHAWVESF